MGALKIHGINSNGYDDQNMELKFEIKSKTTLKEIRKFICENSLVKNLPEKIILIKIHSDGFEEKLENYDQKVSEVIGKKDILKYFILTFASPEINVKLFFEKEVLDWISNAELPIKLLIGNTKDFQVR